MNNQVFSTASTVLGNWYNPLALPQVANNSLKYLYTKEHTSRQEEPATEMTWTLSLTTTGKSQSAKMVAPNVQNGSSIRKSNHTIIQTLSHKGFSSHESNSSNISLEDLDKSVRFLQQILEDDPRRQIDGQTISTALPYALLRKVLSNWDVFDLIRLGLIHKKVKKTVSRYEIFLLLFLNEISRVRKNIIAPLPLKELAEIESKFQSRLANGTVY